MTTFASLPGKSSNIAPMQLHTAAQQRSPFNSLPLAHMPRYFLASDFYYYLLFSSVHDSGYFFN
jgi:hypothetical protein